MSTSSGIFGMTRTVDYTTLYVRRGSLIEGSWRARLNGKEVLWSESRDIFKMEVHGKEAYITSRRILPSRELDGESEAARKIGAFKRIRRRERNIIFILGACVIGSSLGRAA